MHSTGELPRRLGLLDAAAVVVGTTIGAGIFLVPNLVARALPSAPWMIAVWVFTGVLSCLGALAYAELGAMIPDTGGPYVFLREAFGPLLAFLSGWTYFFVVLSASVAWLGINFATYLGQFVTLSPLGKQLTGLALIALVTAVNYRGVRLSATVQNLFTLAKVTGIAVLVGAAFFGPHSAPPAATPAAPITVSGFGLAMIACLTAYDGWISLSAVAGEIKNPQRNIPLAAAIGVGAVITIYVTVNLAYLRVLGPAGIAAADRVGAEAAGRVLGSGGAAFISLTALLSIFGSANGWSLTAPRLFFAQARDGLLFRAFAAVHPRFETPYVSVLVLGIWSALLAVTGTYETLAAYAMYATWVFYLLTVIGLMVLRRSQPARPRPYRMTGYPVTLVLFALVALGFIVNTFVSSPGPAVIGTLFMLAGVPVYFLVEETRMIPTKPPMDLGYEPRPAFAKDVDPSIAGCKGKRIGVLVVTYNATSTLMSVLKRIPPCVWANVEEVAVFDDASPDSTFELAMGLKAVWDVPKLHVLRHEKNLGYGGNQKAGYRYFIEKGFDIVILLHGDGQYAPEVMARLYHPLVEGQADAVFGSRMMRDYGGPLKGGMPMYKYVGNRILTTIENYALGLRLTEFHSGYRAYNLHALARLDFSRMTDDFHFDTEIIIKLHHQSMKILEVPIPTYYGTELCRVDGLRYAKDVVRSVWRYKQTVRSVRRAPEFAEYFVHYPIKYSRHSSHDYALRIVGRDRRVLDIGCGQGFFAVELARNGNQVVGVDALPAPVHSAEMKQYISMDLVLPKGLAAALAGQSFDCVLLLDILEHLPLPERLLAETLSAVGPDTQIVVSVPNVANFTVRLALLFGRWEYAERGILDRTHFRFFTRKSARRFLEQQGCEILETRTTVIPLELVFGLSPQNLLMRAANSILYIATRILPGLLGYQFVFVARPRT